MKKLFLIGMVLLACSSLAEAAVSFDRLTTFTWTTPTVRESGVPLSIAEIDRYIIDISGEVTAEAITINAAASTSYQANITVVTTVENVLDGEVLISATMTTVDIGGLMSAPSDPATLLVAVPQEIMDGLLNSPPERIIEFTITVNIEDG